MMKQTRFNICENVIEMAQILQRLRKNKGSIAFIYIVNIVQLPTL